MTPPNQRYTLLLLLLAGLFSFQACETVEDPFELPPDTSQEYYPLEIGRFWEYRVDSIIFDANAAQRVDTAFSGWVREVVVDTFWDLNQHPWYRIERYERADTTELWSIRQVQAATIRGGEALWLENDLTFAKLIFPLQPFVSWNGNKYIDPSTIVFISGESLEMFKGWNYRILSLDVADTIGGNTWPEVVTVENADVDLGIERRFAQEKYARGVGLVERKLEILDTQIVDETLPWTEKAEKGFILHQRLYKTN